jgi:hypothetical protein
MLLSHIVTRLPRHYFDRIGRALQDAPTTAMHLLDIAVK